MMTCTDGLCVLEEDAAAVATPQEVWGFKVYDVAIEPYFTVVVTFLGLIMTEQAKHVAGELHGWKYETANKDACAEGSADCHKVPVSNGVSGGVDYASYFQYMSVVSVLLQLVLFLFCSSFGDYAHNRRKMLTWSTMVGSVCCLLVMFAVDPNMYWYTGLLFIVSNVAFGFAFVLYNSFLPVIVQVHHSVAELKEQLSRQALLTPASAARERPVSAEDMLSPAHGIMVTPALPSLTVAVAGAPRHLGATHDGGDDYVIDADTDVQQHGRPTSSAMELVRTRAAPTSDDSAASTVVADAGGTSERTDSAEVARLKEKLSSKISSEAYTVGYMGQVVNMLLVMGMMLGFSDQGLGARSVCFACGLWAILFGAYSLSRLKSRPGPPVPQTDSLMVLSWRQFQDTRRSLKDLPQMTRFLIAYFIFSDGVSTVVQSATVFALVELHMSFSSILIGLLEVSILAAIGSVFFLWLQKKHKLSSKTIISIIIFMYSFLPIWGVIALTTAAEWFFLAGVFGFGVGAYAAFARSLYCDLIPPGQEAEFFGFYEITDRGTAWLGPLVVALVQQSTGSYRKAFLSVLIFFVVGGLLLARVDVQLGIVQGKLLSFKAEERLRHTGHEALLSLHDDDAADADALDADDTDDVR